MTRSRHYHKWITMGKGIWQCSRCGLYRCHEVTDFTQEVSSRKLVDIEYSTVAGEIIALNPALQPPCGVVDYA